MRRYLRAWGLFWVTSLAAEIEYRLNFWLTLVTTGMMLGGSLFTLSLLFSGGYEPGGYAWAEALTVLGVYMVLDGVQQCVLAPNRTRLTEQVRDGALDYVLLKPFDAQFWLSLRRFSPWGLTDVLAGLAVLGWATWRIGGTAGEIALRWAVGLVAVCLGAVVLYAVGFALATLTVWFVKLYNVTMAMAALLEAGRYPIAAYPAAYRVFFTAVLPVAFMTSVPADALRGAAGWGWLLGLAGVAAGSLLLCRWFFSFALRSYTSASS